MKNLKKLIAITILSIAAQAQAIDLFEPNAQIGCGTVTSVRKLNQAPLYNQEYELFVENQGNSSDIANIVYRITNIAPGVAVLAGNLLDVALAGKPVGVVQAPKDVNWEYVRAVRVEFDDGRVINVPVITVEKFAVGRFYEVGQRMSIFYNKKLNNIQFLPSGRSIPDKNEKEDRKYKTVCGLRIDKEVADAIIKASEHLVDETKIIE